MVADVHMPLALGSLGGDFAVVINARRGEGYPLLGSDVLEFGERTNENGHTVIAANLGEVTGVNKGVAAASFHSVKAHKLVSVGDFLLTDDTIHDFSFCPFAVGASLCSYCTPFIVACQLPIFDSQFSLHLITIAFLQYLLISTTFCG